MKLLVAVFLTITLTSPAQAADTGGSSQPTATPKPVAVPTPTTSPTPSSAPVVTAKSLTAQLSSIREAVAAQNYAAALTALQAADREFANNADINNLLGFVNRKLKQYSQSATYYTKALKIEPNHLGALEYQGELFVIQKKTALAKKNLDKLKKLCGVKCEEYLDLKKVIDKK
jgi:cytochrome c-type biogenesis protein CcmH/NrfG